MRTVRPFTLTLAAVVALTIAMPLRAQTILGTVLLPDSATRLTGAIVTATETRTAAVSRTLTSARGEFTLRLPAAGTYQLRVLRIGFTPAVGPTVSVTEQATERVIIVARASAVSLAGTVVRERETCRVSADTGLIVARVWEEARKAMLTTRLRDEGAPLDAEWIEYDRLLDSTARVVREQKVRTARHPTTHAFRSVPAELLRDQGFVVSDDSTTTYYAPDAEALLSDAFVSGHCFRLVDAPPTSGLVGVGFTPARDRRYLREIEGTLWVDRATAELKRLDFRYLNLPEAAEPARAGGSVEFQRLAEGLWFISRWNVRMPRLGARARSTDNGLRRTVMTRTPFVLRAVQLTGGEVTRALRGDSMVYRAVGPTVVVQVVSPDAAVNGAEATLRLEGTDYVGAADATGRIRISPVLAGRYRGVIRTPYTDALGQPPVVREIDASMNAQTDTVALPTAGRLLESACPRDSIQAGEGLLHGTVRDEQARAISGAVVVATWATGFTALSMRDGDHLQYSERKIEARTDDAGRWRLCGVPVTAVPVVTVASDSAFDRQRIRMNDRSLVPVDLVLHAAVAEAREIDALKAPTRRALIEIVVADENGVRIPDASLDVQPAGGSVRTVTTGADGRALVADVRYGPLTLTARRLGFLPGQLSFSVEAERLTASVILSSARVPILDTLRVFETQSVRGRHDAFEARRRQGQTTASITRGDIEKRNPVDAWQMLMTAPSVKIEMRGFKVVATSLRSMVSRFDNDPCFMRIAVDGTIVNNMGQAEYDLRDLPRPAEIHGIEVFAGPAMIPPEYRGMGSNSWCGLIVIWTR